MACTHENAALRVEKSLPLEKLARYNDSFDSFREDMWEKAVYYIAPTKTNFKQAAVGVENGRLKVETQTGSFSVGVIQSKFYLRGDFDVQVDCHVSFLKDISDMDQATWMVAIDRNVELGKGKFENVSLEVNKDGKSPAYIFGCYRKEGKPTPCYRKEIDNLFQGSLRIVRVGNQVTLLYKTSVNGEWRIACSFSHPINDSRFRLAAQNYLHKRASIEAKSPFTAWFDNFRINAAQEILEDEI
jgi:hypothetical protein